jgi:glycosyltransferase involved in cell wall biosynthesis
MSDTQQSALPPLHVRGIVFGPSGFAAQGREWLALLEDLGLKPSLHGARLGSVDGGESPAEQDLIERCAARRPQPGGITIQHVLPPHFVPDPDAIADVVITVFETTALPHGWGAHLNQAAAVVVPAPPIAEAFACGGVTAHRVHAIAPPISMAPFSPPIQPWHGLPPRRPGVRRFLSVIDWSLRKGMDVLLPAFARACRFDEAELILKVAPRVGLDRAALQTHCQAIVQQHSRGPAPTVHVLDPLLTGTDLPAVYAGCDALVLPSRGEGWGRPVHEAMLMGMPVVATQAGALATLLPDVHTGYPVATSVAPVSEAAAAETAAFAGQSWWQPDADDLVNQLRQVVRDPVEARTRGRRAQAHVRKLCDHGAIAAKFCQLLDDVATRASQLEPMR